MSNSFESEYIESVWKEQGISDGSIDDVSWFLEKVKGDTYKPHKTGIPFIDNLLDGGIRNQTLTIMMAAPATGKTTLAQQIAESIARKGRRIYYLNFEMSKEQMLAKAISAMTKIEVTDILEGYRWTENREKVIRAALNDYREKSLPYITYGPDWQDANLDNLLDALNQLMPYEVKDGSGPALIVDYLHLLHSKDDLSQTIKKAVIGLKEYAVKFNTFVIAIAATNRVSNDSGRITLSSGRDSSNIEYTADLQIGMQYTKIEEAVENQKPLSKEDIKKLYSAETKEITLTLLKNRFGFPHKIATAEFTPKYNTFKGTGFSELGTFKKERNDDVPFNDGEQEEITI